MNDQGLLALLKELERGKLSAEEVAESLVKHAFLDLDGVTVDIGRRSRRGAPEVVFGEGKDLVQIEELAKSHWERNEAMLVTRATKEQLQFLREFFHGGHVESRARIFAWYGKDSSLPEEKEEELLILSAGASDSSIAKEALETYRFIAKKRATLLQDCGVAGIHRLLGRLQELEKARVVLAVAGMDGVLPTVVAGLISAPIIAVPTSIGYGPGGGRLTPLLTMLASCAPGLTVVNVDNGVGAAFAARRILQSGLSGGGERQC